MGKPIKRTTPGVGKPNHMNGNSSRNITNTVAPRQQVQPAAVPAVDSSADGPAMRFADLGKENLLHPVLLNTITKDLKFDEMMPVQAATLHDLLKHRVDMLAQAKTGTGKTIAFLLPAIQTLINRNKPRNQVSLLVISPTRELALQIADEAKSLLKHLPQYKVGVAIGGTNKNVEERAILDGCNILIATPGRLIDHFSNESVVKAFRTLDTLVLDEADRLLDMGFSKALEQIVDTLPNKTTTNRQGMLFSATMAPRVQKCAHLVLGNGYKTVSTIAEGDVNTHERVPQLLITVQEFKDVAPALVGSIMSEKAAQGQEFKAVVFATTSAQVDWFVSILEQVPKLPQVKGQHSRQSQSKRTNTTEWFRQAKQGILVATDVAARGMDFPGVTNVFQIGLPSDRETYIHRLGRTARAGREGRGVFIVADTETFFPQYTLKDIKFIHTPADNKYADTVRTTVANYGDKRKVYQAWLGYYKTHMKALGWTAEKMVQKANQFAMEGLQCDEVPGLEKTTIGKMGLKGVPGLTIVPNVPRPASGRGRQPAAQLQEN